MYMRLLRHLLFLYTAVGSLVMVWFFFFQAEDGIRDLVRSRGLGDVYKRQRKPCVHPRHHAALQVRHLLEAESGEDRRGGGAADLSLIHI